jgi:hypothetical protein
MPALRRELSLPPDRGGFARGMSRMSQAGDPAGKFAGHRWEAAWARQRGFQFEPGNWRASSDVLVSLRSDRGIGPGGDWLAEGARVAMFQLRRDRARESDAVPVLQSGVYVGVIKPRPGPWFARWLRAKPGRVRPGHSPRDNRCPARRRVRRRWSVRGRNDWRRERLPAG